MHLYAPQLPCVQQAGFIRCWPKAASPLKQVGEMRSRGLQPKLRTFAPALQCFCDAGDISQVRGVAAVRTACRTRICHC
jgi:hypothetical protein